MDPYQPPQADVTAPSYNPDQSVTPRMIEILKKTRPWVLLIAVMGMVFTVLAVLFGLGFGTMMLASGEEPGMAALGVVYLLVALIYFFPCWYLLKFAGAIKSLAGGGGSAAMEEALEKQYSFWRLIGVLTLAVIALYAVLLLVVAIAAVASG